MAVMAGGAILFGGFEIFYNLIDTIQMLSYLKYKSIEMPYNLTAFFEFFGFAQLNIISKYLNLNDLIDPFINHSNLKPIPEKIAKDSLNSLFIVNGVSLLISWISLLGIYQLATVLPWILSSYRPKYYSEKPEKDVWLIRFRLYYLAIKLFLIESCNIIVSEFFFSGLLRIQISTVYDNCFSLFLQINGLELFSLDILVTLSSYLGLLAGFIYLSTIFITFKITNLSKYVNNKVIKDIYGSIFEGIKLNKFSKYFNSILLIQKLIFMAILILGYNFPYFLVINLMLLSFMYCAFLIIFKPLDDIKEFLKQAFTEVNSFITLILITVLVIDGEINYLGWGCIIFISAILVSQLLLDAIQQWTLLFLKIQTNKKVDHQNIKFFQTQIQQSGQSQYFRGCVLAYILYLIFIVQLYIEFDVQLQLGRCSQKQNSELVILQSLC